MNSQKILSVIFVFLLFGSLSKLYAETDFKKNLHQEYVVTEKTSLEISNKYGDVNIKDWDKAQITIDITITVQADDQKEADELFTGIQVNFSIEADAIKAITELTKTYNNKEIKIDWEINMPKTTPLTAAIKYGSMFITERTALTNLSAKYGTLKVNKMLTGDGTPRSEVYLGYSSCTITECNWLKMSINYSNLEITKADALIILSKYSKLQIDKVSSVVAESKYDNTFSIGEAKNFVCNGKYSNYKVDKLSGKLDLDIKYSEAKIGEMNANFDEIKLKMSYGSATIKIDESASYTLKADISYGELNYPETNNMSKVKETVSATYNGTIGTNKTPKALVTITSKYGTVNLNKAE